MSRFTHLAPGSTKKQRKRLFPGFLDFNPLVISMSCTGLTDGIIIHVIEDNKGGLNAYGILEDNRLEVNIRLRSQYPSDFVQQLLDDLRCHSVPILLFQQPLPAQFEHLLERSLSSLGLTTVRICSLPASYLFDLVTNYPRGVAFLLQEEYAAPASTAGVRELVNIIKHAIACKLSYHSFKNLQVQRYNFEKTHHLPGIDRYLALESWLPINFDGTVVRIETTGIRPGALLLAVGFLIGQNVKIYFNSDLSSDFHQLAADRLSDSPGPFAANKKLLVDSWLGTEVDIGLNRVTFSHGGGYFRNLFAGFNFGKEEESAYQIQLYLDSEAPRQSRELAKGNILSSILTNIIFDCLFAFNNAENRWRTAEGDLELFINNKSSQQAIEKFKRRDSIRRRRTRKGFIDYSCRKPRGRLVKGKKLVKQRIVEKNR